MKAAGGRSEASLRSPCNKLFWVNFPKRSAGLLALLPTVFLLGCSSGDSSPQASTSATATRPASEHPRPYHSGGHELGALVVSGGGSSSFHVTGKHEKRPIGFGEEASPAELSQAATTLHDYLVARVEEAWPKACSQLSRRTREWVEDAATRRRLQGKGCAERLKGLKVPLTGGIEVESSEVEAFSLRAGGGTGFLFYRANEAPFVMRMEEEGGTWKVANVEQNALACEYCERSYNHIP